MFKKKATTDFPHDDYQISIMHRILRRSTLSGIIKFLRDAWKTGFFRTLKVIHFYIRISIVLYLNKRYDKKFNVNTWRTIPIGNLEIISNNSEEAYDYLPTSEKYFRHIFSNINIDFSDYTYTDFGSGQGKTLLLASEYYFKKIIGVEFARDLHLIAESNIKYYRSSTQKCFNIGSICSDAVVFPIPDGKCCFYFYSPFTAKITRQVLDNIQRSFMNNPRELVICFMDWEDKDSQISLVTNILEGWGFLHQVRTKPLPINLGELRAMAYIVYETRLNGTEEHSSKER